MFTLKNETFIEKFKIFYTFGSLLGIKKAW